MSQTSEEIEAKLAAYIDGALDEAGRAEIVKHLAANPTHARLLEDLARGRQMLASLPREQAPPEILEAIQSQLERRMLLDEAAQQSAAAEARGSVWARRLALAAVLAMSGTLILVVYSVLPSPGERSRELAELDRAAAHESAAGVAIAPAPTAIAAATPAAAPGGIDTAARGREETPVSGGGAGGRPTGDALVTAAVTPAEVLVLLTDDRISTEADLRSVLVANQLEFEPIADASGAAAAILAGDTDLAAGRQLGDVAVPATDGFAGATRAGATITPPATAPADSQLGRAASQPAPKGLNEAVYLVRNVPRSQVQVLNGALQQEQQRRGKLNYRQQQQVVPAQQQEIYNQLAQNVIKNKRDLQSVAGQSGAYGQMKQAASEARIPAVVGGGFERNQQASESSTFRGVGQAANEPHALPPSAGLIAAGERLVVRVGPVGQVGDDEAEQRVTVSDEGAIQLPGGPPVQALGLTPAELEMRLSEQLRDKAQPNPQVSVRRDSLDALTPQPATAPAAEAAESAVTDLVIVVREEASPEDTAPTVGRSPVEPTSQPAPATQPATLPSN